MPNNIITMVGQKQYNHIQTTFSPARENIAHSFISIGLVLMPRALAKQTQGLESLVMKICAQINLINQKNSL